MSAEPPDDTFPLRDVHGALLAVVPREQEATGSDAARGNAGVAPELDIRLGQGAAVDVNYSVSDRHNFPWQPQHAFDDPLLAGPGRHHLSAMRRPQAIEQIVDPDDLSRVQGREHAGPQY